MQVIRLFARPLRRSAHSLLAVVAACTCSLVPALAAQTRLASDQLATTTPQRTMYKTVDVDGLDIFYREAGPSTAPVILLLHGFPTSSHMFRNLIPALADKYHLIAPDYPGYGQSSMPNHDQLQYTFAKLTDITDKFTQKLGLSHYTLYVMDYGGPVGYRLALAHPERVDAFIVQNGNAYDEGLRDFWMPFKAYWSDSTAEHRKALRAILTSDATRWQYLTGVRDTARISPDNWTIDQRFLDRPGNDEIQLDLFYDYGSNVPLYPRFQEYFRKYQPPMLIVWGKDDPIFPWQGAVPYKRDLKNLEYHILETGHFALEEKGDEIAAYIGAFLPKYLKRSAGGRAAGGATGRQ